MNIEYKKLRSATNILGDFCYVQVNRKIESDMAGIQRAPWLSYRGMFTRQTVKHLCQMMARYRVFVSFFSVKCLKWAKSKQRSQSPNSCLFKFKIYSPRRVRRYLSPGNSIILEIAATLLFICVTIFHWFWGSFCWNSSTLPTGLWTLPAYRANFGHCLSDNFFSGYGPELIDSISLVNKIND